MLPPRERLIGTPPERWQACTVYLVDVALTRNNGIHRALFYSGYLTGPNLTPGLESCVMHPHYKANLALADLHYMGIVEKVPLRLL